MRKELSDNYLIRIIIGMMRAVLQGSYSSRDIRHLNSFTMRALQSPMQHKNQVGIILIYRNRFIYLFQFLTLSLSAIIVYSITMT